MSHPLVKAIARQPGSKQLTATVSLNIRQRGYVLVHVMATQDTGARAVGVAVVRATQGAEDYEVPMVQEGVKPIKIDASLASFAVAMEIDHWMSMLNALPKPPPDQTLGEPDPKTPLDAPELDVWATSQDYRPDKSR